MQVVQSNGWSPLLPGLGFFIEEYLMTKGCCFRNHHNGNCQNCQHAQKPGKKGKNARKGNRTARQVQEDEDEEEYKDESSSSSSSSSSSESDSSSSSSSDSEPEPSPRERRRSRAPPASLDHLPPLTRKRTLLVPPSHEPSHLPGPLRTTRSSRTSITARASRTPQIARSFNPSSQISTTVPSPLPAVHDSEDDNEPSELSTDDER